MSEPSHRVVVVGSGRVGYPLALLAARAGHQVLAVDSAPEVVAAIRQGAAVEDEPGLDALARRPDVRSRLSAATHPDKGDVFVIAVPTPLDQSGRGADLSMVEAATRSVAPFLRPGNLVIVESTVPPGTCRDLVAPLISESGLVPGLDVRLAHCPERVLPGATLTELVHNDRVLGGIDAESAEAARRFYAGFVRGDLVATDDVTAELCKLVENAYRDVNIALANQVASLADSFGVDPDEAIALANRHPRVDLLSPGIGVGGHCIPLDPWFLHNGDPDETVLIDTARAINDAQPLHVAAQIRDKVGQHPNPRVLLIGTTYKPDVADVRESPALRVRAALEAAGIVVRAYDPLTQRYSGDLVELAAGTDLAVILVPHRSAVAELQARSAEVLAAMRTPSIVDFSSGRARPFSP